MFATRFVLLFLGLVTLGAADSPSSEEGGDAFDQARIVGGTQASNGAYPYQVSIRNEYNQHYCGGTIITKRTILTAGHCVNFGLVSNTFVIVGTNTLNVGGTRYATLALKLHPQYNVGQANDIGLIITQTAIVMSSTVKTIAYDCTFIGVGKTAVLTGWGYTQTNGPYAPNALQVLSVKTIADTECRAKLLGISTGDLCTYVAVNKGACNGDSGGPLVYNNRIIGVVSRGVSCAVGYPDVFTRVSVYVSWIDANKVS